MAVCDGAHASVTQTRVVLPCERLPHPKSSVAFSPHLSAIAMSSQEAEQPILIDEEEDHCSTGYSEFCDEETIWAAPDTICASDAVNSSPIGSSPATTLGKRKSPEDPGSSTGVYASYKRQTISTGSDSAESSTGTEPYIIVSLDQSSPSVPNSLPFSVNRHTTPVCNARWMRADFPGESSGKSPVSFHAATAHGMIFPSLTSIASEKRGCPMILSSIILLPLTSRISSGGIKKVLATKSNPRRFRPP